MLNNKGQSLALFICFIPFFILIGVYIVDISYSNYNQNKLDLLNEEIVKYGLLNIENNPKDNMIDLIYKNDSKIDNYDVKILNDSNTVRVTLEKSNKGFFGSIINKKIYTEKSSYIGKIIDGKIIIEKE